MTGNKEKMRKIEMEMIKEPIFFGDGEITKKACHVLLFPR